MVSKKTWVNIISEVKGLEPNLNLVCDKFSTAIGFWRKRKNLGSIYLSADGKSICVEVGNSIGSIDKEEFIETLNL